MGNYGEKREILAMSDCMGVLKLELCTAFPT